MNIFNSLNVFSLNLLNSFVFFDTLTKEEIGKILIDYTDNLLHFRNVWFEWLRSLGFSILKLIYSIGKIGYDAFDSIFGVFKFYEFTNINTIYNNFLLIIGSVLTISLIISVLKSLITAKPNPEIFKNTFISMLILSSLPLVMFKAGEITDTTISVMRKMNKGNESILDELYKNIFIDVKEKLVDTNFEKPDLSTSNSLTVDEVKRIRINELMLKDRKPIHEVLEYELLNEKGEIGEVKDNGYFVMRHEIRGYYRWKFDFIQGTILLVLATVFFVKSSLTLGKLIFELGYNKLGGAFIIATDIETGQRTKTVIREMAMLYISIVSLYLTVIIFKEFMLFINSLTELGKISKFFIMAGGFVAMLKGNSLLEKAFGVQAPIGNLGSAMSSMFHTSGVIRTIGNVAQSLGSGAVGVGKGIYNKFSSEKIAVSNDDVFSNENSSNPFENYNASGNSENSFSNENNNFRNESNSNPFENYNSQGSYNASGNANNDNNGTDNQFNSNNDNSFNSYNNNSFGKYNNSGNEINRNNNDNNNFSGGNNDYFS